MFVGKCMVGTHPAGGLPQPWLLGDQARCRKRARLHHHHPHQQHQKIYVWWQCFPAASFQAHIDRQFMEEEPTPKLQEARSSHRSLQVTAFITGLAGRNCPHKTPTICCRPTLAPSSFSTCNGVRCPSKHAVSSITCRQQQQAQRQQGSTSSGQRQSRWTPAQQECKAGPARGGCRGTQAGPSACSSTGGGVHPCLHRHPLHVFGARCRAPGQAPRSGAGLRLGVC